MITAACHIHSNWSYDGKWTLSALATEFSKRGYRVLLTTEHDRGFTEERRQAHRSACAQASSANMLVVPGIEYSDASNRLHVLVWGPVPFLGEELPTTELLIKVRNYRGFAVLAHPSRKEAWTLFDQQWSPYLDGIEVWNRKTDGWAPSNDALRLVEQVPSAHFAGLDFHDCNQFFPLAMSLEITGPIDEETVLDCLRQRRCRPVVWGRSLRSVVQGPFIPPLLRCAESARRSAAALYRSFKKKRSPRSRKIE